MFVLGLNITPPDFDDATEVHVATQWRVYWKSYLVYDSGITESDLIEHMAEIPDRISGFPISRGTQTFYITFRVKGSINGWTRWSPKSQCNIALGFKKPAVYEIGPIERGNLVKDLDARLWRIELRDAVYIARQKEPPLVGWRDAEYLFTPDDDVSDIENMSFTFDQLGRPVVFYEIAGNMRGYYYDGIEGRYDVWEIGAGRTPVGKLDYRWHGFLPTSDIFLFYIRSDGHLCYRIQSDRYSTEYDTGLTGFETRYLKQLDNTHDDRLCLTYIEEGAGYGNSGTLGDCFTFGFCVSDQYEYEEYYLGHLYPELTYEASIATGSRRTAIINYTSASPELQYEATITSASRKNTIVSITHEQALTYEAELTVGRRRIAILRFPFKDPPILSTEDLNGRDPATLTSTERHGMEFISYVGSIDTGSRRKAIIENYALYPNCPQLTYEATITGGSREVIS